MSSRNFAARAGRWSARHRKAAVFGWIAFVLIAFAVGNVVVGANTAGDEHGPGESGRAERILDRAFPDHAQESVLVSSRKPRARTIQPSARQSATWCDACAATRRC